MLFPLLHKALFVVGNASTTNLKNKITNLQHKKDKKYDSKNIKIISIRYCNDIINFLFAQNGGNLDSTTIRNCRLPRIKTA